MRSKVCKNAYQIISTFNGEYGKHVFEASGNLRGPSEYLYNRWITKIDKRIGVSLLPLIQEEVEEEVEEEENDNNEDDLEGPKIKSTDVTIR